jgi:hypothetical protein
MKLPIRVLLFPDGHGVGPGRFLNLPGSASNLYRFKMIFKKAKKQSKGDGRNWLIGLTILVVIVTGYLPKAEDARSAANAPVRRVNVPYLMIAPPQLYSTQPAVFWFGRVDNTSNYADGRIIYNDEALRVIVHIMDRHLWYDTSPSPDELTEWDAVTLHLNLVGNNGHTPGSDAYRFVAQLSHWQARDNYQMAYQGNGVNWVPVSFPFETSVNWRGVALNNNDQNDRGWFARFVIPFASLGLAEPPPHGSVWGLAVTLHDRDDADGTPIPVTVWPEAMLTNDPSSWGQLHFGLPSANVSAGLPTGIVTIRHGLNGANVIDGHVGGHTVCGSAHWPDYFPTWGDANYAGYTQINVQNQWDIADWPCFSKYFVTFPLNMQIPAGRTLLSAKLTMHQFGNAWGQGVEPSFIQVLTVGEDWDEATITWNNAPLAMENMAGTWAGTVGSPGWPGVPRSWDVSKAVGEALANDQPLRLALYSADGAYHSGRYFSSSDTGDWNAAARPTLKIIWGIPCDAETISCVYLPITQR